MDAIGFSRERTSPKVSAALSSLTRSVRKRITRRLESRRSDIVSDWYDVQFNPSILAHYEIVGLNGHLRADMQRRYLTPLLELLIDYLRTGESRFREVYVDELLRYTPHQCDPACRIGFFHRIVPSIEAVLVNSVPGIEEKFARFSLRGSHVPKARRQI
jgi:hypothetical protein